MNSEHIARFRASLLRHKHKLEMVLDAIELYGWDGSVYGYDYWKGVSDSLSNEITQLEDTLETFDREYGNDESNS